MEPSKSRRRRARWPRLAVVAIVAGTAIFPVATPANAAQSCRIDRSWHVSFVAGNDRLAAAELGWTGDDNGILHARTPVPVDATGIGPWERFSPICVNGPGQV